MEQGIMVRVRTSEGLLRVNVASAATPFAFIKQEVSCTVFFASFWPDVWWAHRWQSS